MLFFIKEQPIEGARVIRLFKRPDQYGFGFGIRKSPSGPHYIANIEERSPASGAGLRLGDLLLRLNVTNMVEKSYIHALDVINRECANKAEIELTVIEPKLCPAIILNRISLLNDEPPPLVADVNSSGNGNRGKF